MTGKSERAYPFGTAYQPQVASVQGGGLARAWLVAAAIPMTETRAATVITNFFMTVLLIIDSPKPGGSTLC
jgi:hypothetical protein